MTDDEKRARKRAARKKYDARKRASRTPEDIAAINVARREKARLKRESATPEELARMRAKQCETAKRHYHKDLEASRAKSREVNKRRYAKKREYFLEKSRERYMRDKARIIKTNRSYRNKRIRSDPHYYLSVRLRTRLYQSLSAVCAKRCSRTFDLLGCTLDFFKSHIESQFQPGMSWENRGAWHLDHIKPVCTFDLTDPDQQRECFHYTNLRPLWAEDNLRRPHIKRSRINIEGSDITAPI